MIGSILNSRYPRDGSTVEDTCGLVSSLTVLKPIRLFLLELPCLNVEVQIGGVAIYRAFGEFHRLIRTVTCMVLKANDRRTSSPLPR
ncbi:hypothetical protein TNCV_1156561 [Trichonephila clavipes]|nr:hypothetical protein TNCV_1156561 [Trichonephila clavipes]